MLPIPWFSLTSSLIFCGNRNHVRICDVLNKNSKFSWIGSESVCSGVADLLKCERKQVEGRGGSRLLELHLLRGTGVEMVEVTLLWWDRRVASCIGWLEGISPHSSHIPEQEHWDTVYAACITEHSQHLHQPPLQLQDFALGVSFLVFKAWN